MKPDEFEKIYLIDWASLRKDIFPYLIDLRSEGNKAVRMGLKKGASDLFFAFPTKAYPGMWIELKAKHEKPTSYQLRFLELMKNVGYHTGVYYGWSEAANAIYHYLGENKKL